MPDPTPRDLLDVAADAAVAAGRRSLAYFGLRPSQLGVEAKSDDTPVTVADRLVEDACRDELARRFPSHTIKGEERPDTPGDPRFTWYIDPIDGTKSFVQGVPLYGTLLACLVDNTPRVGVIYLPALDELVCAADGEGCWHDGRRARVSDVADLKDATILAGSVTRATDRSDAYRDLAGRAKLNRGWGDAFGYALVATGRAEAMIDPKISPWDCAAMPPILREAGGWAGNWDGRQDIHGPDWARRLRRGEGRGPGDAATAPDARDVEVPDVTGITAGRSASSPFVKPPPRQLNYERRARLPRPKLHRFPGGFEGRFPRLGVLSTPRAVDVRADRVRRSPRGSSRRCCFVIHLPGQPVCTARVCSRVSRTLSSTVAPAGASAPQASDGATSRREGPSCHRRPVRADYRFSKATGGRMGGRRTTFEPRPNRLSGTVGRLAVGPRRCRRTARRCLGSSVFRQLAEVPRRLPGPRLAARLATATQQLRPAARLR